MMSVHKDEHPPGFHQALYTAWASVTHGHPYIAILKASVALPHTRTWCICNVWNFFPSVSEEKKND